MSILSEGKYVGKKIYQFVVVVVCFISIKFCKSSCPLKDESQNFTHPGPYKSGSDTHLSSGLSLWLPFCYSYCIGFDRRGSMTSNRVYVG